MIQEGGDGFESRFRDMQLGFRNDDLWGFVEVVVIEDTAQEYCVVFFKFERDSEPFIYSNGEKSFFSPYTFKTQ